MSEKSLRLILQPCGTGYHRSIDFPVARKIAELAVKDGWEVVVYGTGTHHWPHPVLPGVVNLCGKLRDMRQVASVIAMGDLLVCPDSGGYHVAAALEKPVPSLVVFTTINPALRIRDYPLAKAVMGGPEHLPCRPCWDRLGCRGRFPCVKAQSASAIWSEAKRWHLQCRGGEA